jgi:hypothetical protein
MLWIKNQHRACGNRFRRSLSVIRPEAPVYDRLSRNVNSVGVFLVFGYGDRVRLARCFSRLAENLAELSGGPSWHFRFLVFGYGDRTRLACCFRRLAENLPFSPNRRTNAGETPQPQRSACLISVFIRVHPESAKQAWLVLVN